MRAKEYLLQVGKIDAQLKSVEANIKRIRYELESFIDVSVSSSWPDGQPHGTKITDPTSEKAVKIADMTNAKRDALRKQLLEYEYRQIQLHSDLWAKRMEVLETITKVFVPDDEMSKVYYTLLELKYIEGATWESIAVEIGYTWRHTIRLHGEALKRVEAIINE